MEEAMTSFQKHVFFTAVVSGACALLAACGGEDGPGLTDPLPGTSVTVSFAGGPVYIGSTTQFEAREILGNGTTRVPTSVSWSSDKTQVAAVSTVGVVSAVAAGDAIISADVNGTRGSLLVRVLPNFAGAWSGPETIVSCVDSGQISGFCAGSDFVGEVFVHESSFTQNLASVTGVLDAGDGTRATMTGTITVDGDLPLSSAPVLPADPDVNAQVENWRTSRFPASPAPRVSVFDSTTSRRAVRRPLTFAGGHRARSCGRGFAARLQRGDSARSAMETSARAAAACGRPATAGRPRSG
jgi:hypothetical protein